MAQPTIRADKRVPRQAAIAPYDVTLPLGICLATSYTNSKNDSSLFPDGLTVFIRPEMGRFFGLEDFFGGIELD